MRISKWMRVLLPLVLLCGAAAAHAQGGNCPPGYYQVGDPNQGSTGCAPLPDGAQDQQSSPPTQRWLDQWGAIASYIPKGILGVSTNSPTRELAEQAAIQDCRAKGGLDCKIEISYSDQCAAVVAGVPGYVVEIDATQTGVINKSMKECVADGNQSCRALYAACSLPRRIQ
jgi:hypothetical protein